MPPAALTNSKNQLAENLKFEQKQVKPNGRRRKKVVDPEAPAAEQSPTKDVANKEVKKRKRKKREITRCPHTTMPHYAKGMCNHCYHLYGRKSLATKCAHKDRMTYAKDMCQNCYFNAYN